MDDREAGEVLRGLSRLGGYFELSQKSLHYCVIAFSGGIGQKSPMQFCLPEEFIEWKL